MKIDSPALRRFFTLSTLSLFALAAGCSGDPETGGVASLDASKVFEGDLAISGVVEMPAGVPDGSRIQISITGLGADFAGSSVGPAGTTEGDTISYEVTGLHPDGEYKLWIRVDATGDGNLGQADDVEGFYNGTVEAPILLTEEADVIELGTTSLEGIDFGIGEVADIPED